MKICKSHKECFTKICSLCEDYEPLSSHAVLGEVPKCEAEIYIIGNVTIQRLNHDMFWYAVYNNQIIDRDRYRSDLEERVRHFA